MFLMYMCCSMGAFAAQAITNEFFKNILSISCIIFAVVLNADLSVACGKKHYKVFVSGEIRRKNNIDTVDNKDRKSYKREQEYKPYKGFLIGFFVCIVVFIVCLIYAVFSITYEEHKAGGIIILMVSGWAILPWQMANIQNLYLTLISCVVPVAVTGVAYIIGAMLERKDYLLMQERAAAAQGKESNRAKKRKEREERRLK